MIKNRIDSIDLLRGVVMILMALDHVRDYFHADAFLFDPTDLEKTNVPLFFTRWITHYCAPVFVFLAGTSAYMVGVRKGKKELSSFLLKRGLWLIFLELTVINFAWFFNVKFSLLTLFVIWALGVGMIVLAACIYLPWKGILGLGLLLVAGHNLLDGFHFQGSGAGAVIWSMLHDPNFFQLGEGYSIFIGYSVIPWVGVMLLGYCFGILYQAPYNTLIKKNAQVYIGSAFILLFIVLRLINGYGDSRPWSEQATPFYTFLSFLDVSKYPPSLLYVLMTIGPAILFLAVVEKYSESYPRFIITLGRVPMFYYLLHIFLIHLLAVIAAVLTGYEASTMVFTTWVSESPELKGYGFNLGVVYAVWALVVLLLYPVCQWFEKYKSNHREVWWLSYL